MFLLPTLASARPKVVVVILYSTRSCGAASCYGYVDAALLLAGLDCDGDAWDGDVESQVWA